MPFLNRKKRIFLLALVIILLFFTLIIDSSIKASGDTGSPSSNYQLEFSEEMMGKENDSDMGNTPNKKIMLETEFPKGHSPALSTQQKSKDIPLPTTTISISTQTINLNPSESSKAVKNHFKKIVLLHENYIFYQNIKAVGKALQDHNISYTISTAFDPKDQEDTVYITCVTHELRKVPKYYISYNWEQLGTDKNWSPEVFKRFHGAVEVWDYSQLNIEVLKEKENITAKYLPMLYFDDTPPRHSISKNLTEIASKPVDIIFFGALNGRRNVFLDLVKNKYKNETDKLAIFSNLIGDGLNFYMKKCRIGLNIHYYGGRTVLEVHRISDMLLNGMIVLSERSNDLVLDKQYEDIVIFISKETLLSEIDRVLAWTPQKYVNETLKRMELFKNMGSFNEYFDKSNSIILGSHSN